MDLLVSVIIPSLSLQEESQYSSTSTGVLSLVKHSPGVCWNGGIVGEGVGVVVVVVVVVVVSIRSQGSGFITKIRFIRHSENLLISYLFLHY